VKRLFMKIHTSPVLTILIAPMAVVFLLGLIVGPERIFDCSITILQVAMLLLANITGGLTALALYRGRYARKALIFLVGGGFGGSGLMWLIMATTIVAFLQR
jgi:hypothetical protein